MSKIAYRCENEYGSDPCEAAQSNRTFGRDEIVQSLDGGPPKCPGKTLSGKACNQPLIQIEIKTGGLTRGQITVIAAGGMAVLLLILWIIIPSGPKIEAGPNPLTFLQANGGTATASLNIRNSGGKELVIDNIEVHSSAFSVSKGNIRILPKEDAKLSVHFQSSSTGMTEGELVLHSNDKKALTTTIRLIVPEKPPSLSLPDPWDTYRKLDITSRIFK